MTKFSDIDDKAVAWYRSRKWWVKTLIDVGVGIVIGGIFF